MRKRIISCLVSLCLLANLFAGFCVLADSVSTGTVHVGDTLRVRSEPSTSSSVKGYLYNNDIVTIHETVTAGGTRWYRITKDDLSGYASADYITINATYETDEEFEAYLTAQGFPASYKDGLRQLHAQHPSWIFQAKHLSMTWATALAAESKVGLNTIQSPDAWKSMEYGAYNWTTNTYVAYDSGGWVSAAPSLIAYYMDPRNFFDAANVFQFEKLTFVKSQTAEGICAILPSELDKHAADLLTAAEQANVSAYFLAARMTQEGTHLNGLGTGTVAGYEGYYNFFDIGAYAANGNSAVVNGAIYAKNKGWDTPLKCLKDSAEILGRAYISLGQNTVYYQKYNVVNSQSGLYAHQYMTNTAAAASEGRIRYNAATKDELKNALIFEIPVYKDMPASAAPMPSKTGTNNNFLTDITIVGGMQTLTTTSTGATSTTAAASTTQTNASATTDTSASAAATSTEAATTTTANGDETLNTVITPALTPSFDRYTNAYAIQVGQAVTSVTIKATLSDKAATIKGDGVIKLEMGENIIPLVVTATSGEKRTYTITITREGGSAVAPTITGKTYAVDTTVTKVEPNTSVSSFIEALAVKDGTAEVYTTDGKQKTAGVVGTGDILRLYSGKVLCASFPIVIYGDVNGDGQISSLDLRIAQKHILNIAPLKGYHLTAADSNKDGKLTSLDLRITQKYILKITKTLQ